MSFNDWSSRHGLEHFNGKLLHSRSESALVESEPFLVNERHEMMTRVERRGDSVRIVVVLDGKELFDWEGLATTVAHRKFGDSNVIELGCGLDPGVVWETLELRMLDGEATITSDKITAQKRQTSPKKRWHFIPRDNLIRS